MRTLLSSLLFRVLIIVSSILLSKQVSAQCLRLQQSLLLQLKKSLVFETSEFELRWNASTDCCTWDGVACDEGRVTGLDLSNREIIGGLSDNSSLFNLRHLESLDLSFNDFNTSIPSGFGTLSNLSYLNLSNAGFVGHIPIEISRLTNLITLDLSSSYLIRESFLELEKPTWSMLVQNLTKLEELYLDGVNMSATGKDWCRAFSSPLPNLRVLSLSRCSLSSPIDDSLLKLRALSVLTLYNNNFSAPVPRFIANFSKLTSLDLSYCRLIGTFTNEIFQIPTLQTLRISNNELLLGTLPDLSPNNSFRSLVLSSTNFSGRLPESVGNLGKLTKLHLDKCKFNGTLPTSMSKLTQLVSLDLSTNRFTGPTPSFNMSKNLTRIILSHNGLSGSIPSTHLAGLPNLVFVDLQDNFLSGNIPSSLFKLPSLEEIRLSYNEFNGQLPTLSNVTSSVLAALELTSNNLTGSIPTSIFDLKNLNILSLSFNKLNGTTQLDMICRLGNLTLLDLSYNNLSVDASGSHCSWSSISMISTLRLASCNLTMFPDLRNQPWLVSLDLSDNKIHGEVPNWIWEVGSGNLIHLNLSHNYLVGIQEPYALPSYLITLDLHSNQINAKVPVFPPFCAYIDLSNNFFTSPIPTEIGYNLSFLSLSNNSLTGVIPVSICNFSYLQVLDFSYNNLHGSIPACVTEIMTQKLGVLNLQGNNLSGSIIHDAFPADCSLKTLQLNANHIQGRFPKSLAHCSALEVLDLGNNEMVDKFPCLLENISTLRVVILRSNEFYGSVECASAKDSWRMIQIFDIAHNNLSGELPRQWLTKSLVMTTEGDDAKSKLDHLRYSFLQLNPWLYYKDTVTVSLKGLNMNLVKILTIFTYIDLSSNNFHGSIPEEFGKLYGLYILNLSSNAFTGQIPPSLGNLRHLESLDLSRNSLSGTIPTSLGQLNFLSFLNLSYNHLVGSVPKGSQLQTFLEDSFAGNDGMCGFPLKKNCTAGAAELPEGSHADSTSTYGVDWALTSALVGFFFGLAVTTWPLLFSERWRRLYFGHLHRVSVLIFPRLCRA